MVSCQQQWWKGGTCNIAGGRTGSGGKSWLLMDSVVTSGGPGFLGHSRVLEAISNDSPELNSVRKVNILKRPLAVFCWFSTSFLSQRAVLIQWSKYYHVLKREGSVSIRLRASIKICCQSGWFLRLWSSSISTSSIGGSLILGTEFGHSSELVRESWYSLGGRS